MSSHEMPSGYNGPSQEQLKEAQELEKAQMRDRRIMLVRELTEGNERFPFSGINPHSYTKLKAEEEDFPGFVTPIDELIQRFKDEGMKIAFGIDQKTSNVVVIPFGSDDIAYDSIRPKHLNIGDDMDRRLRELIELSRT